MGSVMCQDVDWIIIITIMKMNTIHKYTVRFRFQIRSYISPIIGFKASEIFLRTTLCPSLQHIIEAKRRSD